MKLYSKILGLTCALILATASSALAVTYIPITEHTEGVAHSTGDTYTGPEVFFTDADRLPHREEDQSQRVSVMIKKFGSDTTTNAIIKADTESGEKELFVTENDGVAEEIIYINESDPELDTQYWHASDAFEASATDKNMDLITGQAMRIKGELDEGRYALFIGTSHDLQEGEHTDINGDPSPLTEDDKTPIYTEYFNVYGDSTKSIGMHWKEMLTGDEMRAQQAAYYGDSDYNKCPALSNEYHVAFIADLYGYEEGDSFGIILSYKKDDNANSEGVAYQAIMPTDSIPEGVTIHGGAAMRFGIEMCKVPEAYKDTFKGEGFIIPGGATE